MKNLIVFLGIIFAVISCRNNGTEKEESRIDHNQTEVADEEFDDSGNNDSNVQGDTTNNDAKRNKSDVNNEILASGLYLKTDNPEDGNCSCYCLDIKTSGTSELCLSKDKLYINGRFEQNGKTINIFYAGKSSKTQNNDLPWDKFDKTQPVAVLSPSADGYKLDWKGFKINGEVAVDYALFGKKTLEGTYKLKQ